MNIDPPGVQNMIVEHIVKTGDATMAQQASVRLRAFSGRTPHPPNEPDFDTWKVSVELLLSDPSISDFYRSKRILDSLLPPASDVVKHVRPPSLPAVYLELLASVYGSVEDGDEQFMSTLQNSGEKSSEYLHRLQVILSTTVKRGGLAEKDRDCCLLKQFFRGCWDSSLITSLQLEKKETRPPTFTELVLLVRTEESRHTFKEERMKRHLGISKNTVAFPKLRTVPQPALAYSQEIASSVVARTDSLKKQIAEIQAQVAAVS